MQIRKFVKEGNVPSPNRTSSPLDPIIASCLRENPKQRPSFSKLHDDIVRVREEFENLNTTRSRISVDSTCSIMSTGSRTTRSSVGTGSNTRNRFSMERRKGQFSNMLRGRPTSISRGHRPKSMPLQFSSSILKSNTSPSIPPPPPSSSSSSSSRPRQLSTVRKHTHTHTLVRLTLLNSLYRTQI
jgi:hypothetical protein